MEKRMSFFDVSGIIMLILIVQSVTGHAGAATLKTHLYPAARRNLLLKDFRNNKHALPMLQEALNDENAVLRRTAARLLAELRDSAQEPLKVALKNEDFIVRRTALLALGKHLGLDSLPYFEAALKDKHVLVRHASISFLVGINPRTDKVISLLKTAEKDKSDMVRKIAVNSLWPFYKETVSIRDRFDYDHEVEVISTISFPKDEWLFHLDPESNCHLKKWFEPVFDDSSWETISIESAWQKFGYDYIGVAWYRRWFTLPQKPEHIAVEIHFKGVDECAWVWINGEYVGQHAIGPHGWDKPFRLDVTKQLRWGKKNHITVRAMNTKYAGGIWRPVELEILK